MDLKFIKAELLRKRVALVLAAIILLTTIFISILAHRIEILEDKIDEVEAFAEVRTEEYLQFKLATQHEFLASLQRDWDIYSQAPHPGSYEDILENFLTIFVKNKLNLVPESMIIVVEFEGEILYIEYDNPQYDGVVDKFLTTEVKPIPELQITNGTAEERFGLGERFYTIGRQFYYLADLEKSFMIHLTFFEPIAYTSLISTLNIDLLMSAKTYASEILYISVGFFLVIIFIGVLFLAIIRWFVIDALKQYINVTLLGEILVNKGYITRQQLEEALTIQLKKIKW